MNVREYIKELRKTADQLEALFGFESNKPTKNETPEVARKILEVKSKSKSKKKHWTQKPENKAKLNGIIRKMQAAKAK